MNVHLNLNPIDVTRRSPFSGERGEEQQERQKKENKNEEEDEKMEKKIRRMASSSNFETIQIQTHYFF